MEIYEVTDEAFREYGRVIADVDFSELLEKLEETPVRRTCLCGVRGTLEELPVYEELTDKTYGELRSRSATATATTGN